jgi:RNA polymerase sigma-70 factor (ECF subfamily)
MIRADEREDREEPEAAEGWLRLFHEGDRPTLERIYRAHFEALKRSVGAVLGWADRDTVVHDVFLRLMTRRDVRASFQGGRFGAWLVVIARNQAIDYLRRRDREVPEGQRPCPAELPGDVAVDLRGEARVVIDRFRKEVLPPKWAPVFEARFVKQLTQEEAAAALGMGRSTLAYQEARVRRLLRRFVLEEGR